LEEFKNYNETNEFEIYQSEESLAELYRENGGRPYYRDRATKGFKEFKEKMFNKKIKRNIQLKENLDRHVEISKSIESKKQILESSYKNKELLSKFLIERINEASEEDISKSIKKELESIIKTDLKIKEVILTKRISIHKKEKIIKKFFDRLNPLYQQLFVELRKFDKTYENYVMKEGNKSLIIEGEKTVKNLAKKLESVKKTFLEEVINEDNSGIHNYIEYLRKNLYRIMTKLDEKAKINKIIQKDNITGSDKKELISILSKLPEEELLQLIGQLPLAGFAS